MLLEPIAIVGSKLYLHYAKVRAILALMNGGVHVVDIHFNAVDRLGDEARIIGINPIDLIEHRFHFRIRHQANIADDHAVFSRVNNCLGEIVALSARHDQAHCAANKIGKSLCATKILLSKRLDGISRRGDDLRILAGFRLENIIRSQSRDAAHRHHHAKRHQEAE